jgi:hypothetical protein
MTRMPRLVVLAVGVAGSLILAGASGAKGGPPPPTTTAIAPVLLNTPQLKAEAKLVGQPFYWAGWEKGYTYEFRRTTRNDIFVRYLPHGVPAGDPGRKYLIVATYPLRGAFAELKRYAHGKDVPGPHGSILYVNPSDSRSVFIAFPHVNYEIEIYDHQSSVALAVAQSGKVQPVGP